MSYGSYACYDVATIDYKSLKKICQEYKITDYQILNEIETLYFYIANNLDDCETEFCEIVNAQISPFEDENEVKENLEIDEKFVLFYSVINVIKEKTGLDLELNYVDETGGSDDSYNQEFYWSISNAFQKTEVGKKFDEYITNAAWVIYG